MRKSLAVPAAIAAATYVLALCGFAWNSATAYAGQWVQVSCENPSGSSAPSQGWTSFVSGSPGYGSNNGTSCNAASPMYAILSSAAVAPVGTGEDLQYTPPGGSTLAGGEVQVYMEAFGGGLNASGTAVLYTPNFEYSGSSVFFQCAAGLTGCSPSGAAFSGVLGLPSDRGGDLYIGAGCGGTAGYTCDSGGSNGAWSFVYVYRADLLLANDASPAASGIGGPLLAGSARGEQELAFEASDTGGPGVYTVTVQSEGKTLYEATPNTNSGQCVPVGEYAGALMFDYAQPCRTSESVDIPVETTGLKDGQHTLKVSVEDAAGNSTVVYDGTITTDNAPQDTSAPAVLVSGGVTVGTPLSAQAGAWSDPQGAGAISYTYQWQDCNSEGEDCKTIPGAESASYTPAPSDAGHTLRLQVTAADSDGASQASSNATPVVEPQAGSLGAEPGPGSGAEATGTGTGTSGDGTAGTGAATTLTSPPASLAPGFSASPSASDSDAAAVKAMLHLGMPRKLTRSFAERVIKKLSGRLLDGAGHPVAGKRLVILQRVGKHGQLKRIAHAKTGAKGAFSARVPAGPSRLIEVAYQANPNEKGYAATATVKERVRAGVKLTVTPRSTSQTGTILLSGRVLGKVPAQGVVVELLVHYRGRWEPFRDPRTDGKGRFQAAYQFQGARGRFPFRAQVMTGQASFPFTTGESEVLDVQTH